MIFKSVKLIPCRGRGKPRRATKKSLFVACKRLIVIRLGFFYFDEAQNAPVYNYANHMHSSFLVMCVCIVKRLVAFKFRRYISHRHR